MSYELNIYIYELDLDIDIHFNDIFSFFLCL